MGAGLEFAQGMTGYRYFEYGDMLTNSIGVLFGGMLARSPMGRIRESMEQHGKH